MNFVQSMGFKIYNDTLKKIPCDGKAVVINTISPNSYGISTKDVLFKSALKNSDFLVLDGVYFALASIFLNRKNIKKNQGLDVFNYYINRTNNLYGKVFFLGSSPDTLKKIKLRAEFDYPKLTVSTYSPPFKDNFSNSENEEMIKLINEFQPDVLFVGMTCPKQEKWVHQNKDIINVPLICCIGAVFDWYGGAQKEIHSLWWKLRFGWLKRTIDRPEILLRYPDIGIFFKDLFLTCIRIKKFKNE